VHNYGDISDPSGMSTGGHFVGACNSCRPAGSLQEVGLLDDGKPLVVAAANTVTYSFLETVATLRGPNSIVGRSVVVHSNGTNTTAGAGVRVAQCVIGWDAQTTVAPREWLLP
jgi:Cu/Zn superoxide dismutase